MLDSLVVGFLRIITEMGALIDSHCNLRAADVGQVKEHTNDGMVVVGGRESGRI